MFLAMVASSSIGPIFKFMSSHGVPPFLASSWRGQCMSVFLIPLAIVEYYMDPVKNAVDWFERKEDLPYPVIVHVTMAGLSWGCNLLTWIVGLQYISTFEASVFANAHPIMLTIYLRCTNVPVSNFEYIGVFISFLGLIVSSAQELSEQSSSITTSTIATINTDEALHHVDRMHELLGIGLCLIAAAGEVFVMMNRMITKKYVPLMQVSHYIVLSMCNSSISHICLIAVYYGYYFDGDYSIYYLFSPFRRKTQNSAYPAE